MEQSESIAKLGEALAKAQGIIEGASKDSNNPFFKSKYADLAAVWDACRKPMSDNGLSIVQSTRYIPEHPDLICLVTTLLHASGEWMRGELVVKPVKCDPQSIGSCLTYMRRYSLQSMVGIAPEDDDGNAASGNATIAKQAQKKPEPQPEEKSENNGHSASPNGFITEPQRKRMFAIAKKAGWPMEELKEYLADVHGIESSSAIPKEKYEDICEFIESRFGYAKEEAAA